MVKCVVSGCPNRRGNCSRGFFNRPPKRFFSFPADPARVKVWLAALRQTDRDDSSEQLVICEDHFLPQDISRGGVNSDAIPLMPPYLDGQLGLMGSWGAPDDEEQWPTRGCSDDDEDEGAEDPPQQDSGGGLESPAAAEKTSVSLRQRNLRRKVTPADGRLDLLTRRFLKLLLATPDGSLDLGQAATSLQTSTQRICDIINVLDDMGLVQKESANRIKWTKRCPVSSFLWRNQSKLHRELENLKVVEGVLNGLLKSCARQHFDMTDNVDDSALAYVTFEDIRRLRRCWGQTLIIIQAPSGTKLEIPAPREDGIQIHLKADRRPIIVMTCEVGSGDTVTSDPTETSRFFVSLDESRIRTTTLHTDRSRAECEVTG